MKILVVEDQENIAEMIKDGLEDEGFAVDYVLDGQAGLNRIEVNHDDYDLIVLDLMLPKKDGVEICKAARAQKIDTPILMLTARDSIEDITRGLDAGADDYLTKPFSLEVLAARIRAILRRPKTALPTELKAQSLVLNPVTKIVYKNNQPIKLTLKEFSLLEYLMRNPNQAISREQIITKVWDFAFDSFSNVVDVHITNLRKSLGDQEGKIIETIRGVGYKLNA